MAVRRDEPAPYWNLVFDEILPQLVQAPSSGDPVSRARLEWAYARLLAFRARHASSWPREPGFEQAVDAVHDYRAARGWPADALAESDYDGSADFEAEGRLAEVRGHLEHVLARYPPGTSHRPHILVTLASYARHCRELERAGELLQLLGDELAAAPADPVADEARVLLHLERTTYLITVGLPELAHAELEQARERIEACGAAISAHHAEKQERLWPGVPVPAPMEAVLRAELLVDEMNLANTFDDFARTELLLERARAQAWFAPVEPSHGQAFELRLAHALADRERLHPDSPPRAAAALEAFLQRGDALTPDERVQAHTLAARLAIDASRLDDAEAHLLAAERDLGAQARHCTGDEPSAREVDLMVLRARLALARQPGRPALRAARDEAERAFESMLRRWAGAPLHDGGRSLLLTPDRLRLAESVIDLSLACAPREEAVRASLLAVARVQTAGSLARALGARVPSVDEVRALVPPAGGLLVLLPGSYHTWLFCVDERDLTLHALPPVQRIDPARGELLRALDRALRAPERDRARLNAAVTALDELLFPSDVRGRIAGWQELVVVGMDGVGYLPFELLPAGAREPLGRRVALSYAPSLPVAVWLGRERPPRALSSADLELLLVAAPDAPARGPALLARPALSFGEREERRLLDACGLRRVAVRRGESAGVAALTDPAAASAAVVQVIAHTVDSTRPDRPKGLLLADPESGVRVLEPAELERLHLGGVVVLTACSAGQGPLRRGDDGRHHLGGAAFVAGARTVVLSYLDVEYQAALRTGAELLAGLARGLSPARAMLVARGAAPDGDLLPFLVHVTGRGHEPVLAR